MLLLIRLWFDVLPGIVTVPSAQLLATLGAAAIVAGNVVALRQKRLKLLVAYSTVAQIGYLFLMFPLAFDAAGAVLERGAALDGGTLQAISHALAKAAMFMAAGIFYYALGHDRIADLAGAGRALPITLLTFVLAGVALMGLPPSGAYVAKKLLLDAAAGSGQWWWEVVLQGGAFLTAAYVVLVLAFALRRPERPVELYKPVSRLAEGAALSLALGSLLLGFLAAGSSVPGVLSGAFSVSQIVMTLGILAGGAVLAAGLALQPPPLPGGLIVTAFGLSARIVIRPLGLLLVRLDSALRQWTIASIALLLVALAFGMTLLSGQCCRRAGSSEPQACCGSSRPCC